LFWGYDYNYIGDSTVEMTGDVAIPAGGTTYLQFDHSFEFEYYYDGGVLEYSTNGGTSWSDAGGLITAGAQYNGSLSTHYSNLLGGRDAFVRDSYGYTATRLNLLSLAGSNFRLRFRIGTDSSVSHFGWFIDNVRIYQCVNRSDKIGIWRKENDRFAKFYFDFNGSGGWDGGDTASGPMGWNVNGIWDTPVVGDWDGDGDDDIGIWRKENNRFARFYFDFNGSGGWDGGDTASGPMGWNVNGIWDTPVVGRW